jgi:DNA-binding response OmpR family regulator
MGFDVSTASSGQEALDRIDSNHLDVVLLDLQLPDLSGLEVLKAARDKSPGSEVIIGSNGRWSVRR